jgi:acyl-coenzyme A thioesterase PaaI-like protein
MTRAPSRSTDEILRHSAAGNGPARVVTLDPRFQGLPDTAHGGTVLALFDAVAGGTGARVVSGVYRRRVPLGAPLQLAVARDGDATHLRLSDGAVLLVDGSVAPSGGPGEAAAGGVAPPGLVGRKLRFLPSANVGVTPPAAASPETSRGVMILPLSKTCFACGVDNTLGLHAALEIDDDSVGGVWTPRDELRAEDGTLAGVAVTALLDEAAFWLGAAASGEAGMTTDLRVRLHAAVAFGRRIVVGGAHASMRAPADDARYWDTEVAAWDEDGTLVATASITFVAVRGAARKLVAGLLAINPPEVLRRVFPLYAR